MNRNVILIALCCCAFVCCCMYFSCRGKAVPETVSAETTNQVDTSSTELDTLNQSLLIQ